MSLEAPDNADQGRPGWTQSVTEEAATAAIRLILDSNMLISRMACYLAVTKWSKVTLRNRSSFVCLGHQCNTPFLLQYHIGWILHIISSHMSGRTRVVVLGGGFAGASLAVKLASDPNIDVTLISRLVGVPQSHAGLRQQLQPRLRWAAVLMTVSALKPAPLLTAPFTACKPRGCCSACVAGANFSRCRLQTLAQ